MNNDFLGKGFRLPITPQVASVEYAEAVRQSIAVIIGTRRGERVMRPDFGCRIHDMVFALNSSDTIGQIKDEVHQALLLWEPRIDLITVTADFAANQPTLLYIRIDYVLRADNSRYNLVYPFYLTTS